MKEDRLMKLELPPIGIKLLDEKLYEEFKDTIHFSGVSYCQGIFGATFGMELIVNAGLDKNMQMVACRARVQTARERF